MRFGNKICSSKWKDIRSILTQFFQQTEIIKSFVFNLKRLDFQSFALVYKRNNDRQEIFQWVGKIQFWKEYCLPVLSGLKAEVPSGVSLVCCRGDGWRSVNGGKVGSLILRNPSNPSSDKRSENGNWSKAWAGSLSSVLALCPGKYHKQNSCQPLWLQILKHSSLYSKKIFIFYSWKRLLK